MLAACVPFALMSLFTLELAFGSACAAATVGVGARDVECARNTWGTMRTVPIHLPQARVISIDVV
ncbi:hypothetical protein ABW16_16455 [Mycolicibacter heraklionensis]|uniref:Pilus assembly protein TadE n=1 Tax=Mycolicibacter heraklionensis TaxID=512402 RepID=A0ABR5FCZ2_9MYCO|nr:hypothetical protein ABW16_16455 [Mycolicibacter heraklionensis]